MELTTNYPTKAALMEALEAGTPTSVRTGGNVWLTGPITVQGPNFDPTVMTPFGLGFEWQVAAEVENGFIVPGSVA